MVMWYFAHRLAVTSHGLALTDLCHSPKTTHLFQDDASGLVDGSPDAAVLSRVADEGPRQHGHHSQAHSAVTYQGEGAQADEEQHTGQHVQEAHQHKQHCRSPEGTEEIFGLLKETQKGLLQQGFKSQH